MGLPADAVDAVQRTATTHVMIQSADSLVLLCYRNLPVNMEAMPCRMLH